MTEVCVLWDEAQLWGLLAWRGVKGLGLRLRLARASEISEGLLQKSPPAILLVPGGSARHKAQALGPQGLAAIRRYVEDGGHYLGFCGGAGLGLASDEGLGLNLCPWGRGAYTDRMQHFMSGHMLVSLPKEDPEGLLPAPNGLAKALPVWWPGRFCVQDAPAVRVLAHYQAPGPDFWLADLPVAALPEGSFADWSDLYGLNVHPDFLAGQPCLAYGRLGRGDYTLSYSHLETPDSPFANIWLAHLAERLGGARAERRSVPAWNLDKASQAWADKDLERATGLLEEILRTGLTHGLLFARTTWLTGWRAGVPGMSLNNLKALLWAAVGREPAPGALAFWLERREAFMSGLELFAKGAVDYLLAERLAQTLDKILPGTLPRKFLQEQRKALFGPPMQPGGLYGELVRTLDELARLQLS